jgi:hypothetical protein
MIQSTISGDLTFTTIFEGISDSKDIQPWEFGIETPSNSTINVENQTAWPKQHWYNTIWERQ